MDYAKLAHRNSVATKELASAVIAWVYRRVPLLVVCEIPGGPIFCQPIAFGPPTTASARTGAGGPQPPREGSNKTTYGMREVGTELRERGTRAPGLALLARCQRSPG
jgi:hypothetical protein